jgi:alcohol dehydrogenase
MNYYHSQIRNNGNIIEKGNRMEAVTMNMEFNFNNPTNLIFGVGSLEKLGEQTMPGKKAMVLISSGKSTRVNGYLYRTLEQLKKAKVETAVFDKIMENPVKEVIMEGAVFARENNCDFIVALGGGAVIDSSSAISAMATNDGDLWDYVYGGTGKGQPLKNPGLPIVAIATTSGTGSELNGFGVISNLSTNEKIGFGDSTLTPVLAIVDPELMTTVPAKYTAFQGFDALFHNTEVMISRGVNIMSETIALAAIESIAKYLPIAVKDGKNIKAREYVAFGSTVAGMTMQLTSTTAAHSMEHSMSAYHHNLPHGAGLIMISEAFYRFFIEHHACDEQFIKMAKAMGMRDADKPEDFITALLKLQKECGVDNLKMGDYGLKKSEAMTLAVGARAMQGGLYPATPWDVTDEDIAGIFEKSNW